MIAINNETTNKRLTAWVNLAKAEYPKSDYLTVDKDGMVYIHYGKPTLCNDYWLRLGGAMVNIGVTHDIDLRLNYQNTIIKLSA
jgi:hypothetical protein